MRGITGILAAVVIAALAFGTAAHGDHDFIKKRQEFFKMNGAAIKAMQRAIGDSDNKTVEREAKRVAAWAKVMTAYFPDDSHEDDPKTDARPEIWQDFDRFTQYAEENRTAALELMMIASDGGDASALREGLGKLGATCQTCHTAFKY